MMERGDGRRWHRRRPRAVRTGHPRADLTGRLMPQASRHHILRAADGQVLHLRHAANAPDIAGLIRTPTGRS